MQTYANMSTRTSLIRDGLTLSFDVICKELVDTVVIIHSIFSSIHVQKFHPWKKSGVGHISANITQAVTTDVLASSLQSRTSIFQVSSLGNELLMVILANPPLSWTAALVGVNSTGTLSVILLRAVSTSATISQETVERDACRSRWVGFWVSRVHIASAEE